MLPSSINSDLAHIGINGLAPTGNTVAKTGGRICSTLTITFIYQECNTDVADVYIQIYTKVYSRYGSYIIGLAVGYILYKFRTKVVKIHRTYVIFGWLVAFFAAFFVIVFPRWMYYDDHPYDRLEASFYAGFHRQIFALSVSWIIFCSVHGYAGFVGQFLSWNGWVPFSRLTYSAYLCHYVFLLTDIGSTRTTGILSSMGILRSFFSNLCLTLLLSVIWTLCFEMPFMTLDRMFFFYMKGQSNLGYKPDQEQIFGSLDSGKGMYRSTEESSPNISQTSFDSNDSSNGSVYDSAGNVNYQQGIFDTNCSQDLKHDRDNCPFIFVTDESKNNNTWPKVRNSHRNNGFDSDSEEFQKLEIEKTPSHDYESIISDDLTRRDRASETTTVNRS